jgi:hypothetical protein
LGTKEGGTVKPVVGNAIGSDVGDEAGVVLRLPGVTVALGVGDEI